MFVVESRPAVIRGYSNLLACASPELEQLIWIDIDCHGDVFGEWQFVESFADEAAEAHDGFTAD